MIYGLQKSKLDGTELQYKKVVQVPEQFKYRMPPVLDQGDKPICVPCSVSAFLNWDINLRDGNATRDNNIDLMKIFNGGGGTSKGMSFKNALEYLKGKKRIAQYGMINSEIALKTAILLNGPCVGGLVVRDNSNKNFWEGDKIYSGHAIAIIGWTKEGFLIRNSWGRSYGDCAVLPNFMLFTELWTMIA